MSIDETRLSRREAEALRALMLKRSIYLANGKGLAANALGVAIWLVWQVFTRVDGQKEFEDTHPGQSAIGEMHDR